MGKTKLSITSGALNNFTVMLAGLGAVAAAGASGTAIALGAVQIGCGWVGLVKEHLSGQQTNVEAILNHHLNDTRKNWHAWSDVKDPGELKNAILCFEDYFASPGQATMLDATGIIAIGRDAGRLADAMLAQAEKRAEGCYRDKPINTVARKLFRDVTVRALDQLFADPDFAKILQPAFQHAVLASQSRLEVMVRDIWQNQQDQQGLPLLVAQKLALRFGASRDMLVDPGQIAAFLEAKAKEYVEFKARLSAPSNEEDPIVQQFRRDAAELMDEGEFNAADEKLRQAEEHDEACERELEESVSARQRSRAKSHAERGDLAELRLAYGDAAGHYAEAASIMRVNDSRLCWRYEQMRALVLYTLGLEFGDNGALSEAISLYRNTVLPLADRKTRRDDWATTQNNLGNALSVLGERESGTKRLDQAVKAYNEALKEWTRARVPLDWAITQNNLGAVLSVLGKRENGTLTGRQALATRVLHC